jgi:hypothetical protein
MQTFMTRKSYHRSMHDLDDKRLINQFEEAMQLARVIGGLTDGYRNHPAAKMWMTYDHALNVYIHNTIQERVLRWGQRYNRSRPGAVDPWVRMDELSRELREANGPLPPYEVPPWFEDLDVLRSHRSNLLRKLPGHYGHMWNEAISDDWPYLWPIIDRSNSEGYYLYVSKPDAHRLGIGERVWPEHIDRDSVVFG